MDDSKLKEKICWRKEVDQNQKRLQSLLFGAAELCLEKQDFEADQILSLRLVGFLDSHSHSEFDKAFIRPIRTRAVYDSACRALVQEFDRVAFDQAGKAPGCDKEDAGIIGL